MAAKPSAAELKEVLEIMVEHLIKCKLLPPNVDKKQVVESVSNTLLNDKNVTIDLTDKPTIKALGLACVAAHQAALNMSNPAYKKFYCISNIHRDPTS